MCAPCAASSSASRRCTAAYAASSYSPRPIPDWLVTITTNQPAWFSRRIAAAAPDRRRTFPGSCRKPGGGSSTIVPSRSRNTARWRPSGIEGGTHRAGELLDLVGEDGPGVEDHAVVRDAGDNRGLAAAQPLGQGVGCQVSGVQRDEPCLELRAGERTAADLGFAFDDLGVFAHAFVQRLCVSTYLLDAFRQHPQYRYLHASPLRIPVQCERRLERRERELVGPHGAGERIGAAGFDRGLAAEQNAGLRPAQQLVARERDSIDAAGERLGHGRLAREPPPREVEQQAAPQIEQTRDPGGARDRGDLLRRYVGGETRP